ARAGTGQTRKETRFLGETGFLGRTKIMRFQEMTWPLLREIRRDLVVVLAPIAACEQHSRHLPTITDTLLVTAVAEGVEKRLPDQVLLLPTLWLGASSHHLRFGATLS